MGKGKGGGGLSIYRRCVTTLPEAGTNDQVLRACTSTYLLHAAPSLPFPSPHNPLYFFMVLVLLYKR